ncbi:MAG: HD domain-containing protein [Hahellaceae bacterium]|nr:HD domain-containing protein [Hahellaceae bacterium]
MRYGFVRLDYTAILLGKPLKFPVYTGDGRLLLNKGYIVRTREQLETLITRGIYQRIEDRRIQRPGGGTGPAEVLKAGVNPFTEFDTLATPLRAAATLITQRDPEAGKKIRLLVSRIEDFCEQEPDACLGKIHFQTSPEPLDQALFHALLCCLVSRNLGLDIQRGKRLIAAALTANLALLPFQDKLNQSRSSLNEKQREVINKHPQLGALALRQAGIQDDYWLRIIEQHHERFDGSGYPGQLKGPSILAEARILAAVEYYTSLITDRAYREPISPGDAQQSILAGLPAEEPTDLYLALIEVITPFPPGALVQLVNGEIALVTHRSAAGSIPPTPRVKAIINPKGGYYAGPLQRHTDQDDYRIHDWHPPCPLPPLNLTQIWGLN